MSENEKHVLHYLVLIVGLVVTALVFFMFRYNTSLQSSIAGAGSLFYILWGIIHHALEKRLNKLVILEYFLLGSLVFILVYLALNL